MWTVHIGASSQPRAGSGSISNGPTTGFPDTYNQGFSPAFYEQSKYAGLFAQGSWRVTSNLTLNYGVRWDLIMPWEEEHNQTAPRSGLVAWLERRISEETDRRAWEHCRRRCSRIRSSAPRPERSTRRNFPSLFHPITPLPKTRTRTSIGHPTIRSMGSMRIFRPTRTRTRKITPFPWSGSLDGTRCWMSATSAVRDITSWSCWRPIQGILLCV
jgi:hypothetical protein